MASVAGILNPSKNSIEGDQLLAYYINSNCNLALKVISLGAPDGQADVYSTNDDDLDGYVMDTSSLAVLPVKNITGIYGVITTDSSATNTGGVALLSPVLQPLGIQCEAIYGRITTAADPEHGQAWIYYRKPVAGQKTPGLTIYQASLTSVSSTLGEIAVYTAGSNSVISDKTYLAAYYNTKSSERHIIFQQDNENVWDYNIDHGDLIETNASPGRTPTGLAAIFIPQVAKTFLYFVCKYQKNDSSPESYELWKTEWVYGHEKWLQPVRVTPTTKLVQTTQLHVTARPDRAENYVTYFNTAGQPACVHDKWETGYDS